MNTVSQVMAELEKKGTEQTRKTYARHGVDIPLFGVKISDLKVIAKKIKGNQELADELYFTGNYDAMYLAGIVADGRKMTKKQIEAWVKGAKGPWTCAYTVAWIATESSYARELAMKWIDSKNPIIAVAGWGTYSGIVATRPDDELDLEEIRGLLKRIVKEIRTAQDRVRYMMNGFVISVGGYVKPLLAEAKKVAKTIGAVECDMGDTACEVPDAATYIAKIESKGRIGVKRKTMRC